MKKSRLFYLPPSFTMEAIIRVAVNVMKESGAKDTPDLHRAITGFAEYIAGIERHEIIKKIRNCETVEEAIDLIKQRG